MGVYTGGCRAATMAAVSALLRFSSSSSSGLRQLMQSRQYMGAPISHHSGVAAIQHGEHRQHNTTSPDPASQLPHRENTWHGKQQTMHASICAWTRRACSGVRTTALAHWNPTPVSTPRSAIAFVVV